MRLNRTLFKSGRFKVDLAPLSLSAGLAVRQIPAEGGDGWWACLNAWPLFVWVRVA